MREFKYLSLTSLIARMIVACKTRLPIDNLGEKKLLTFNSSKQSVKKAIMHAGKNQHWFKTGPNVQIPLRGVDRGLFLIS